MGLFSPYKDKEAAQAEPAGTGAEAQSKPAGKAAPTPKRREAEAARRQRVNPQLSPKEARKKARQVAGVERRKQMVAMDSTPGKVLIRNHVDSRFNFAEYSMPILMALLVVVLVVSPIAPNLVEPSAYVTWAFMGLVVLDIVIMWRSFKRLAAQRIPSEPLKGLLYYGFNRAMTLRRLRIPRPVVKRGEKI
ncbi:MAG: DUF3043 domain-containing protein [Micropruina sp.]|nr:DUF3043 domain-containing protein [Micropruina sp.]